MSDNVYAVHLNAYGDFRLAQIFTTRRDADAFTSLLNEADDDAFATVVVYPKRDGAFALPWWMMRTTVVHSDGTRDETREQWRPDAVAQYVQSAYTEVSRTASGTWVVTTHGDASLVPQAHADAIAKAEADGS